MRPKVFTLSLAVISLLIGCQQSRTLRSDIKKFIASFSVTEARKVYLEAGYTTTIISTDQAETVKQIESIDFNIKDTSNITFDHKKMKYVNDVLTTESHQYVSKTIDGYFYIDGDKSTATNADKIIRDYVSLFFYKDTLDEKVHSGGMYVGDWVKEVIYDMQKYVTIDKENEEFIYDMPFSVKKDAEGFDFEELMVLDKYGIVKSCHINATNGIVTRDTTISVYNI